MKYVVSLEVEIEATDEFDARTKAYEGLTAPASIKVTLAADKPLYKMTVNDIWTQMVECKRFEFDKDTAYRYCKDPRFLKNSDGLLRRKL